MRRLEIDPASDVAPYEQVRMHIAGEVADGRMAPGEKLPTVRALAAELGLAVNTVARAFRELETDGVIVTRGRRGSFVSSRVVDGEVGEAATAAAKSYARAARTNGVSLAEATRLLERAWSSP